MILPERLKVQGAVVVLALVASLALSAKEMEVEDLGNGQYRIGAIKLDKNKRRFEVPGHVISQDRIDAPIEFLAVSKGGMKSYEAVIELDATAVAFNAACLLIGLNPEHASHPRYHFDPEAVKGDAVTLTLVSEVNGARSERPLTDLVLADGKAAPSDWVYTGSGFTSDGRYLAEEFGTLVGVVHDPDSIIQHRTGLGLGNYGAIVINPALGLKPGQNLTVQVSADGNPAPGVE